MCVYMHTTVYVYAPPPMRTLHQPYWGIAKVNLGYAIWGELWRERIFFLEGGGEMNPKLKRLAMNLEVLTLGMLWT